LTDASPRLAGESTRDQQPNVNQPFTFKFGPKNATQGSNNDLWKTVSGDGAWSLDNRTLATSFREASREGKDFPVRPVYGFNAEFLSQKTTLVSVSSSTGELETTQTEEWIPSSVICPSPWVAIDAKRVGVVPG
jgi:hypothetical protein